MYRASFIVSILTNQRTIIYHKCICLYNEHFYMFRHILCYHQEVLHLYLAKLHKILKSEAVKITFT